MNSLPSHDPCKSHWSTNNYSNTYQEKGIVVTNNLKFRYTLKFSYLHVLAPLPCCRVWQIPSASMPACLPPLELNRNRSTAQRTTLACTPSGVLSHLAESSARFKTDNNMKFMALTHISSTLLHFNNVETGFKTSNITVIFHLRCTPICHLCCWKPLENDIESLKRIYPTSIIQSSSRALSLMLIKTVESRNVLD